ncbi:type II toxin-antitoxin system VapC family toxin [Termitidicoccus mucosus]|uniref:DNA-binding protein n=1 Tax=Termitidicoccus mucosus TaxID=1184151 RepID=A0A178IQA8_9BACT|nr:DNA-binding protein [Opitutaceae bacterium TSB47]
MKIYADTSFLASLYNDKDTRHGEAVTIAQAWTKPPRLPLTPFGMLELRNVLSRLQHKGQLRPGDARMCEQFVKEDLRDGILEPRPLRAYEWMEAAMDVTARVTPLTGTRTLDAMHIALAKLNGAKTFLSFDANQRKAAQASGFALLPA